MGTLTSAPKSRGTYKNDFPSIRDLLGTCSPPLTNLPSESKMQSRPRTRCRSARRFAPTAAHLVDADAHNANASSELFENFCRNSRNALNVLHCFDGV